MAADHRRLYLLRAPGGTAPPARPSTLAPSARVARNAEVRADLAIPTTTTLKYLDITVATPMKQEFLRCNAAATTPGVAAAHAERTKHVHYEPYQVTPLAMETFGRWGEEKPSSS